ncbi:MAG: SDR family oxidoreductase [Pseudomonadota bacterium]
MTENTYTLITGASAGIGKAIAERFASEGHNLVLVARRLPELTTLAEKLSHDHGVDAVPLALDLSDDDASEDLIEALGDRDVETVINNAGVLSSGSFRHMDRDRIESMIELNVVSLTDMCRTFSERLVERGGGRIVNVASIAAFQPVPNLAVYAATKAYVLSLSEALSLELGRKGVTVTAVCPGFTDTDMLRGPVQEAAGKINIREFTVLEPETVARAAYKACMRGDAIEVPGIGYSIAMATTGVLPRWIKRRLTKLASGT